MAERDELEAHIVDLTRTVPGFRARLLAEPRDTIAEACGAELPDGLVIRVEEEQPGEIVLVLPPADAARTLTDAELAGSGGGMWRSQPNEESYPYRGYH